MGKGIGLALALCMLTPILGCSTADPVIESTTRLEDTQDPIGPYTVESVVLGVARGDKVEIFYNVDNQLRFIPVVMAEKADGELFIGAIPGRPAGSRITYYVAVTNDDGVRLVADPVGAGALPYSFRVTD